MLLQQHKQLLMRSAYEKAKQNKFMLELWLFRVEQRKIYAIAHTESHEAWAWETIGVATDHPAQLLETPASFDQGDYVLMIR